MHELFAGANKTATDALTGAVVPEAPDPPVLTVPVEFLQLCQSVILHSDADRVQAQHMAQSVQRDMHKMKAFVHFRTVQDEAFKSRPESGPLHVAWFEPDHHIVKAIAPFFARRFTQKRWAILTPECSVDWSGASLHFGPGAVKADAPPADAGEQLWLTYYQTTFNPARLKLKSMQKEMPRRHDRTAADHAPARDSGSAASRCRYRAASTARVG